MRLRRGRLAQTSNLRDVVAQVVGERLRRAALERRGLFERAARGRRQRLIALAREAQRREVQAVVPRQGERMLEERRALFREIVQQRGGRRALRILERGARVLERGDIAL